MELEYKIIDNEDGTKHVKIGMICIHSEEGKQEADELMKEVIDRLNAEREPDKLITMDNFLSAVVYSLQWYIPGDEDSEPCVSISGIYCDMWAAVCSEQFGKLPDGEYGPIITARVECDKIEHGIAATWKAWADNFGENNGEKN